MSRWKKLGLVFCANQQADWMMTHSSNPVAENLGEGRFKIYFSTRDKQQRSSIASVIVDINHPSEILELAKEPILSPGAVGLYDDSGVSMGCLVQNEERRFLYYIGWNLGVTVLWRNSVGLAVSDNKHKRFEKYSLAPVMDRNAVDPYSLAYPWVLKKGDHWQMWYGSNLKGSPGPEEFEYVIKYAESDDGVNWRRDGHVALGFKNRDEYALARPCVIFSDGIYKMWYTYRGKLYRIGYAESRDGKNWQRLDNELGLDVSASGWDSEMVCYPCVFQYEEKYYLLYNGNGYGKSGFGLAVLE